MTDRLVVLMGNDIAGVLTRAESGRLRFDYENSYRKRPGATSLSVSMPVQVQSHHHQVIEPWLQNALPDNQGVLQLWGRHFHVSPSSPFSLLGTPIGEDCAGAVRFVQPNRVDSALARGGNITWLDEEGVAERLRDLRRDPAAWLGLSFTGRFSLAGAQAKTALFLQDGRWGVASGSIPTTHILKPAAAGFDDHDLNEHLCLDAARRVGLLAARTRVDSFGSESAVIIKRYDRVIEPNEVRRVHQEDLCQALGISPSGKYQNEGGPAPKDVAALLRHVIQPRHAEAAVRQFADALIWNWLIAGTDAHAKNYSLLLAGNEVRLAPLYDVASALPYGIHERRLRFAMKVGGDYQVVPRRNPWTKTANELGLDADYLVDRAKELTLRIAGAFSDAAAEPSVKKLGRAFSGNLIDLIDERARRCSQSLDLASVPDRRSFGRSL